MEISMRNSVLPVIAYAALALVPLAVVTVFGSLGGYADYIYELGRSFALIVFAVLLLQPVLAGRFREITEPYGLDMVVNFHKYMGVTALCLIIAHPLLLALGGRGLKLLTSLSVPWEIWLGKAALLLLLIQAGASLFRKRLGLDFERWRRLHDILAPTILVLAAVHSYFIGGDLKYVPGMRELWVVALLGSAGVFVYHRFIRPKRLPRYTVRSVEPAAQNVWTVTLAPPDGRSPRYEPGQFHFLTFRSDHVPEEEHHFTISSSPTEAAIIASTIKESGDFTRHVGSIAPGDTARVHGPFGRYSYVFEDAEVPLVFIAGGIGITPLRAMLRHMADTGADRRVALLYACKTEADIVFRAELDALVEGDRPRLDVTYVLSRPDEGWSGSRGHIDTALIRECCAGMLDEAVFFVCGPEGMAKAVLGSLTELGVPMSRIRREEFLLLD
ncbi:oxidoreductase [Oceanidesulfovibrio marinus]|uniref:Oxidoreductase n=2 Tax=Oceanidesulfovibrio marinus TaxID=370038 RepID=A0ABX6NFN0_9BACT|nr:oxidoreductase [Oceanidesulfovibrio marinus]